MTYSDIQLVGPLYNGFLYKFHLALTPEPQWDLYFLVYSQGFQVQHYTPCQSDIV